MNPTQFVTNAQASRRDLVKYLTGVGLGSLAAGSLLGGEALAQDTMTLAFDAAATGGGGGRPNATKAQFCWVVNGGNQFEINRMVDARLVTVSSDLSEVVGDLADSWDMEDTKITFHLNPKAKWHDGEPVTSKDVAFTINLLTNPAATSRWGVSFSSLVGVGATGATPEATPADVTGVETPDDHTVVLNLTQVDAGMLVGFDFICILPEHILGDVDPAALPDSDFWIKDRIGAGPYKWVQLVDGERVELTAFEDYYKGAPAIKNLNLLYFTNYETSLAAFTEGSSLVSPMTANDVELVKGVEGAEIVETPAGVGAIWFNVSQPEFSDKRVRQAFAYAIDKKTIAEQIYLGSADAVSTEIPYISWAQPDDANPYDYDPDKAKQLLDEAGWDGSKTFVLWYYYPDQVTQAVMEAMQQYLADVGVTVELRLDDGSGARTKEIEDNTWYLVYGSIGAQPDPANLSVVFGPPGKKSFQYSSDEFNAEMEAGLRSFDQDTRAEHYKKAIKILNEDSPWIWLFDRKNQIAVNSAKLNTGDFPVWGPGSVLYLNRAETWTVSE